jgi:hypothetical protein
MEEKARTARHRETGDLAFAAYAHLKGLRIVKAEEFQRGKANEYRFTFDDPPTVKDPNGLWDELFIKYANSESSAYDSSVRTLKKLCKRNKRRN